MKTIQAGGLLSKLQSGESLVFGCTGPGIVYVQSIIHNTSSRR